MTSTTTRPEPPSLQRTGHTQAPDLVPRVDIVENKDGFVLEAEMPGVSKEGLEIRLENHELTLLGRRVARRAEGEVLHRESVPRNFHRMFTLDPAIDTTRIDAKLEDGVLRVFLPKAERVKPRRIEVTG